MAYFLDIATFSDDRGRLTVLDDQVPFAIRRLFYIYDVDASARGGHRHHKTYQAAICIKGSCTIDNHDGDNFTSFKMDSPGKCLILEPRDWHIMKNFSTDAILLVLASTPFDPTDYIFDPYPEKS
ncbi:sugar 3,4-ketoisomerase [Mucilaginibacter ginkgonis]|uniref:FdtA/QdtA family cupin domain-containing protein n=1 Tax=Mucilaginibacter ginkgonis TaxID=2682091 RepID=A0A6I4I0R6_9SPHI|nr:FdtA/QdtA family cupin domain-containing protein [Mucilaginibacter ginkgonis]QQL48292.1 FdtA/QdtA family cupin domain-containing protein [Mucilaginibacter ginkgonis]